MSLRTRVAIAVGVVVLGALAVVAAVVYPAVGAKPARAERPDAGAGDQQAPQIATKLKKSRTPFGQLVPFGDRSCRSCPTPRPDQRTGSSPSPPRRPGGARERQAVLPRRGLPGPHLPHLHRAVSRQPRGTGPRRPAGVERGPHPDGAGLAAPRADTGRRAGRGGDGAAGRGAGAAPGRQADGNRRADQGHRRPQRADRGAGPGRDQPAGAGLRGDDGRANQSVGAQRRLVADASHELRTPLTSLITNLELLAERPDDPSAPRRWPRPRWPRPANCAC